MDAVRGSYICFVDSDDYVSPDYFPQIERALDILEATAQEFGIELPRRNYD